MARPTLRTPEIEAKLEQAFSLGSTIESACFYAGIGESTYHDWAKADPEFSERNKALKQKPVLKALQTIVGDLDNVQTAKWYAERKQADLKPVSQTKHVTDDGKGGEAPIQTPSVTFYYPDNKRYDGSKDDSG